MTDIPHDGKPRCLFCGNLLVQKSPRHKYCSLNHRQAAFRRTHKYVRIGTNPNNHRPVLRTEEKPRAKQVLSNPVELPPDFMDKVLSIEPTPEQAHLAKGDPFDDLVLKPIINKEDPNDHDLD